MRRREAVPRPTRSYIIAVRMRQQQPGAIRRAVQCRGKNTAVRQKKTCVSASQRFTHYSLPPSSCFASYLVDEKKMKKDHPSCEPTQSRFTSR